jgi:WD40 repeat protein
MQNPTSRLNSLCVCLLQDYIYLHKEHNDWVTKIQWIPELGLVTSSLDATIKTFDINR